MRPKLFFHRRIPMSNKLHIGFVFNTKNDRPTDVFAERRAMITTCKQVSELSDALRNFGADEEAESIVTDSSPFIETLQQLISENDEHLEQFESLLTKVYSAGRQNGVRIAIQSR